MADDRLFDLNSGNILPTRDDDIFGPVTKLDIAIRMPDGEITRVEIAAVECFIGCFRIVEIASHDIVAVHDDFTDSPAVPGHVAHPFIDHANRVGDQHRHTLAGEFAGTISDLLIRPSGLPLADRIGTVDLRKAIYMDHPGAKLFHLSDNRRARRRPRRGDHKLTTQSLGLRRVGHSAEHGRGTG